MTQASDITRKILVIHGWHVSSNGFDVHDLGNVTMDEAEKTAGHLAYQRNSTFDKTAHEILEVGPYESVKLKDPYVHPGIIFLVGLVVGFLIRSIF